MKRYLVKDKQAEELHLYKSGQINTHLKNKDERLSIGTKVKIVDKPEWGREAGTVKTITGHCSYFGKDVGYILDGEGIYLIKDFEVDAKN